MDGCQRSSDIEEGARREIDTHLQHRFTHFRHLSAFNPFDTAVNGVFSSERHPSYDLTAQNPPGSASFPPRGMHHDLGPSKGTGKPTNSSGPSTTEHSTTQSVQANIDCLDVRPLQKTAQRGDYWVLYNYILAERQFR
ncbi:unnamed protein product [Nezara viridula]|uniref:Uncharacterized protein n=1 Tax=Nezara viridula TaxID=85310 RepID=A0A9P0HW14_NEZVI|nr:unnamed protein product [Nezara viridula]